MQPAKEAGPRKTWDVLPPVEGCVSTEVPGEEETRDKSPFVHTFPSRASKPIYVAANKNVLMCHIHRLLSTSDSYDHP